MKRFFLLFLVLISTDLFSQCDSDTINPWFTYFEHEPTISCDGDISLLFPVAEDNCDDSVEIAFYEEVIPGICPNNRDIFRVYRAFDEFGNSFVQTQIIHVVDETPPTFLYLQPDTVLGCLSQIEFEEPLVEDNCGNHTLTSSTILDPTSTNCEYNITKIWTAVDECGNSDSRIQLITLLDTVPPNIIGDTLINIEQGQPINTLFVTVLDNCNSFEIYFIDETLSGDNILRTYTATDECGNESTFIQIIHVNTSNNVAICHRLGNGNWMTMYVPQSSVSAHLAHGDYLGPCNEMSNNFFPYNFELVKDEDGKVRKYVRVK